MKLIFSNKRIEYVIDACGKTYGELCQAIAALLTNKNSVFISYKPDNIVKVKNLYQFRLSSKNKLQSIVFHRHSGYGGGFKTRTLQYYIERGLLSNCIRNSIRGMMKKTKCTKRQLANLQFI